MDEKAEELRQLVAEIRDRVRARHPSGEIAGGVTLPDLNPLLHARDAAEGKVASIGTVNPRPAGFKNSLLQFVKRTVARALDWHVREQVEFNRAVIRCVQSTLEILNENNRALAALAAYEARIEESKNQLAAVKEGFAQQLADVKESVVKQEIQHVKNLGALQAAFDYRVGLAEQEMRAQHGNFTQALGAAVSRVQEQVWADLAKLRSEQDAMIHSELRVLRQRMAGLAAAAPAAASSSPAVAAPADWSRVDWLRFSERFRGSEEYVRREQQIYPARFAGCGEVVDLGCGRGELLETLRTAGVNAHGVELSGELAAICRAKGLSVEQGDMFQYLEGRADQSLDAIACMQVVEHIPRPRVPELIQLAHAKLKSGGVLAVETPNPECLAIFASHFYLDPTHRHPLPPALLSFYLEEAGFTGVEVVRLSPAADSMPEVQQLPEAFRERFFGGLDYAIFGRRA